MMKQDKNNIPKTNSPLCAALWNHFCIRSDYKNVPCCRFDTEENSKTSLENPLEALNTPALIELREKVLRGEKLSGCESCYKQEDSGIFSLRNGYNENWNPSYPLKTKVDPAEINYLFLFLDNACNLRCHTCGPESSSSWKKEYSQLGWETNCSDLSINYSNLIDQFENLKEVKFIGGEPFYASSHQEVLKKLSQKNPQDISLIYHTNATVLPSDDIVEFWLKFKKVTIHLSIDGYGKINDYIRFPSRWQDIQYNIEKFSNYAQKIPSLYLRFLSTISVYNIWELDRLDRWFFECQKLIPERQFIGVHYNPIDNPGFLSLNLLFQNNIEDLLNYYHGKPLSNNLERLIGSLKYVESSPELYERFKYYTDTLDRSRGTNFKEYIPHLQKII